jgi:hypothetical protein
LARRRIFRRSLFGLHFAEQVSSRNRLYVDALTRCRSRRRRYRDISAVRGRTTLQQQPGDLHELPSDGDDEDYSQRLRQGPCGAVQPLLSRQRL